MPSKNNINKTLLTKTVFEQIMRKLRTYVESKLSSTPRYTGQNTSEFCNIEGYKRRNTTLSYSRLRKIDCVYKNVLLKAKTLSNNTDSDLINTIKEVEAILVTGIQLQNTLSRSHNKNQYGDGTKVTTQKFFFGLVHTQSQAIKALQDGLDLIKYLQETCDFEIIDDVRASNNINL